MLAQQDLIETSTGRSPALEGLERVAGSPYKEAVSRGEIAPSHGTVLRLGAPRLPMKSKSSRPHWALERVLVTLLQNPSQHLKNIAHGEDGNSPELFTSTQGINATATTFETTPKSALNQAEMVEIPRRVPTRPKNFTPRSRRGPQMCPASQGGCGSAASSQERQYTTQEDGQ